MNWLAILLAGVADWLLGAVWFTAFANQWKMGLRMPAEEMQAYMSHPNFWPYLIALLCSFLMAYVIARLVAGSATHTLFRGIIVGILIGLAAALAMVTEMVFEIRPGSFILISAGYPLVGCILMGIIIGAWKPKGRASL
ncbi:MAG: DUF1761 domain-containing protein [Candidatus Korobacteraceae bacterium]